MPPFDPANPDFDLPPDRADCERWRRFNELSNGAASISCPTDIEFAAWIDNRIDDATRREMIESHLASCPVCMQAVLEVRQSLASQADSLVFVAPEILAAAKALVSPTEIDVHVVRHVRLSRSMGIARWSGAAAASVLIGIIGWQAGEATNVPGESIVAGAVANADANLDDDGLPVSELSLGALDDIEDEDDFDLMSLSFDEGSTS